MRNLQFYKEPLPLLIGSLPFGEDFRNKKDEYEFLDVYKTIDNDFEGIIYYSRFFKKYTFLKKENVTWQNLFPKFDLIYGVYTLNPFINDTNGYCSWLFDPSYYYGGIKSDKIYYNSEEDRYENGLGEDVVYNNGKIYTMNNNNYFNGYFGGYEYYSDEVNNNIFQISLDRNASLEDITIGDYVENVGYKKLFNGNDEFDFDELTNENNFDNYFSMTLVNGEEIINGCALFGKEDYFLKNDEVKDIDHLLNPSIPELLGVYENQYTSEKFALGSWVLGNLSKEDFGLFVGVNDVYTDGKVNGNVINLKDKDYQVVYGYSFNTEKPKYLIYLKSESYEEPFIKNRLFISESQFNLTSQRKIWYTDLPINSSTPYTGKISLFNENITIGNEVIDELRFKYINLDDPNDKKEDLVLEIIGLSRKNPGEALVKANGIDTYIGFWTAPVTNIKEE